MSAYRFIRETLAKDATTKYPFKATIATVDGSETEVTVWPDWIEWPPAEHAPDPHPEDIPGGGWWSE